MNSRKFVRPSKLRGGACDGQGSGPLTTTEVSADSTRKGPPVSFSHSPATLGRIVGVFSHPRLGVCRSEHSSDALDCKTRASAKYEKNKGPMALSIREKLGIPRFFVKSDIVDKPRRRCTFCTLGLANRLHPQKFQNADEPKFTPFHMGVEAGPRVS